jgi:hypothetical protein
MNFVKFEVTGTLRNGVRFKKMQFSSFNAASMINVWNGSIWGVTEDGKRKLLRRVYN